MDPQFLIEVADGFERTLAGEIPLHSAEDYVRTPVREAKLSASPFSSRPGRGPGLAVTTVVTRRVGRDLYRIRFLAERAMAHWGDLESRAQTVALQLWDARRTAITRCG